MEPASQESLEWAATGKGVFTQSRRGVTREPGLERNPHAGIRGRCRGHVAGLLRRPRHRRKRNLREGVTSGQLTNKSGTRDGGGRGIREICRFHREARVGWRDCFPEFCSPSSGSRFLPLLVRAEEARCYTNGGLVEGRISDLQVPISEPVYRQFMRVFAKASRLALWARVCHSFERLTGCLTPLGRPHNKVPHPRMLITRILPVFTARSERRGNSSRDNCQASRALSGSRGFTLGERDGGNQ